MEKNNASSAAPLITNYNNGSPTNTPILQVSERNMPYRINLTVNSAKKISFIDGINSRDERWLVIDLSIKNGGFRNGIIIKKNNFVLMDPIANRSFSPSTKPVHVGNLWTDKRIPLNGNQRGEIVFDTPISPDTYILIINDDNGIALGETDIKTVRVSEYTSQYTFV